MALEITDTNFQTDVEKFDGIVLVDFWATWCTPCKIQGPIVEQLAEELKANAKIRISKLNVDENPVVSEKFQILSIPTLKIFKNGEIAADMVGLQSKEALLSKIKELAS